MKKNKGKGIKITLIVILTVISMFIFNFITVFGNEISVEIDGNKVIFDNQVPIIIDGRTLVLVRGVFEELGFRSCIQQINTFLKGYGYGKF